MAAKAGLHLLCQSFHFLSGPAHQLIPEGGLLLVGVEQFLFENVVCQCRLNFADAIFGEIRLSRLRRPRHHVDMGMVALVMESGVPAKVTGRDIHSRGDIVAVSTDQVSPLRSVIVSQPLSILPFEGDDVCPDVAVILIQLFHSLAHIHSILIAEQSMGPWALCHVLHVAGGQQFNAFPGSDVLQVTCRPAATTSAARDIGTLDD